MVTFHDYTQLIRISQRRITAAWHDLADESLYVTPSVARQAAEGIIPWDMDRSIQRWEEDLQDPSPTMTDEARMITQVKIWWAKQWQHPHALYRVRVMNAEEQRVSRASWCRQSPPSASPATPRRCHATPIHGSCAKRWRPAGRFW